MGAEKGKKTAKSPDASLWKAAAALAIVFFAGAAVKLALFSGAPPGRSTEAREAHIHLSDPLGSRAMLVAAKFRCACGGCNELPLVECTCDMPQGSVEEKRFIRQRLLKGLSVDEVVRLVDEKYGHRIT